MRYAAIDTCECVNAKGWGVTLYTQGCPHHCPGCFNPETWDFDGGAEFTDKQIEEIVQLFKNRPEFEHLVIEGGEPLMYSNIEILTKLVKTVKQEVPHIKVWIYTGFLWEDRVKDPATLELFKNVNVVVDGPFIQEEKDLTLAFKGSKNQRIIACAATLYFNEIKLLKL